MHSRKSHNKSFYCVTLSYLFLAIVNGYLFTQLNKYLHIKMTQDTVENLSFFDRLFVIGIMSPVLETILFQYIIIEFCLKVFKIHIWAILISSIVFCSVHFYNPIYLLMAFVGGLILSNYYLFVRANDRIAIIYTAALHAVYNLYGLIFVN